MITYRSPNKEDATSIYNTAKASTLDLNSTYSYLMMASLFSDTCLVAEENNEIVGFVTGFIPVKRTDTFPSSFFVWQIAVRKNYRGRGIAYSMIDYLIKKIKLPYLEAHVTKPNKASMNTFNKLAREYNTSIKTSMGFHETDFPVDGKDSELLLTIGPFDWK